jgi:hypothetical protein
LTVRFNEAISSSILQSFPQEWLEVLLRALSVVIGIFLYRVEKGEKR